MPAEPGWFVRIHDNDSSELVADDLPVLAWVMDPRQQTGAAMVLVTTPFEHVQSGPIKIPQGRWRVHTHEEGDCALVVWVATYYQKATSLDLPTV